jgi:archaeosine-15-forming tRNA-guanine transglycosylase
MTIFIGKAKMTNKGATEFISKQHDLVGQTVRAWYQSNIDHHFKNDKRFRKAIQKNQEILHSRGAIEALFTSKNYRFSTKAEDRKETLYFEDCATKRTGRLRQQHEKGPLARIDRKSKTRRFLSQERFECIKEWHDKHKHRLPCFRVSEEVPKNRKHLIEFTYEKKKKKELSAWHSSEGTIKMSKHDLDHRIGSALENILGIPHGKSH